MIDRKLNLVMTLFGGLGGALGFWGGQALWALPWPRPVLVGLLIGLVGLCAAALALLAETLFPVVNGRNWKRAYAFSAWKFLLPVMFVPLFVLGLVFQWLYQTDFSLSPKRDVYLVIDRSGSMEWNDPHDERLAAAGRLIETFNTNDRVEIIAFDNIAEVMVPLTAVKDKDTITSAFSEIAPRGGTDLNEALRLAYERLNANQVKNRQPYVIMLSDGVSELDDTVLRPFAADGIPVNVIGLLLENVEGEAVLAHAAQLTGGQFVTADSADSLDLAFNTVYQADERFILNTRSHFSVDGLQWLLFALTGLCMALLLAFLLDNRYILKPLAIGGLLGGLLAGGILCWPVSLLPSCVMLGSFFTLFTLFAKSASSSVQDGTAASEGGFLSGSVSSSKTHGRF